MHTTTSEPLGSQTPALSPAPPTRDVYLLTMEQAAAALTIGKTKMYDLLKSGDLQTRFIGRRRVVAADELVRYISTLPTEVNP